MSSVKINKQGLDQFMDGLINKNKTYFTEIARNIANDSFKDIKEKTMENFDNNPANIEIEEGPDAGPNILPFGNLFSFIGFVAGTTPVEKFRAYLDENITLDKKPSFYKNTTSNISRFYFKVNFPTNEDIAKETKDDVIWDINESWPFAIENGISNLSYYLFFNNGSFGTSRSGPALQIDKQIHPGADFPGTPYLTDILGYLREKLDNPAN